MKRTSSILSWTPAALCILYAFVPACHIIGAFTGYTFTLCNYPISIMTLAAFSLAASVLLPLLRTTISLPGAVLSSLVLPLCIISGLCFVFDSDWVPTIVFVLICCACCFAVTLLYTNPIALKILSLVLSFFLLLFMLLMSFIDLLFQDFSVNTVSQTVISPGNAYTAEVIDNDQGALGGNTFVHVQYNRKPIRLLFCQFSKSPIQVYAGYWGESESIQVDWKDEHTLIVDGTEYEIN